MRSVETTTESFVERMGQLFEQDGLPRIAGRILGHLLLQTEPQSLDALASALQVSKASVSTDTRRLEALGVLERVTLPGDRRDYYVVSEGMPDRVLELKLAHLRSTLEVLGQGLQTQAAMEERVRRRMERYTSFFEHMIRAMTATRESWAKEHGREVT